MIVHVADESGLDRLAAFVPDAARRLARACWPGPLTVVVRRAAEVPDEVTGGRDTVGVRVPDQAVALRLLRGFADAGGRGVAAPSANRFGRVSPTTAADVRADLGDDVDLVLDGGPCAVGVESTIVDCSGDAPAILRLGGVGRERVEEILGVPVPLHTTDVHSAPGTLPAHYAPPAGGAGRRGRRGRARSPRSPRADAPVCSRRPGRSTGRGSRRGSPCWYRRSTSTTTRDVLYARLREADARDLDILLVVPPAREGIGAAVDDRLRRAAASSPDPVPGA